MPERTYETDCAVGNGICHRPPGARGLNRFGFSGDFSIVAKWRTGKQREFRPRVLRYASASRCQVVHGSRGRLKAVPSRPSDCCLVALERPSLFPIRKQIVRFSYNRQQRGRRKSTVRSQPARRYDTSGQACAMNHCSARAAPATRHNRNRNAHRFKDDEHCNL
jgi:hypothetical protein